MIDPGLLWSVLAMIAAPVLLARLLAPATLAKGRLADVGIGPLLAGVLFGRVSFLAMEDLATLSRPRDVLIIRGGVEFWAGLAAGVLLAWRGARRDRTPVLSRLAALAPFGLFAAAAYEGTCFVREGCYGPSGGFGVTPKGLSTPMLPLGLLVGVFFVALGLLLQHWWALRPSAVLCVTFLGLAGARSLASFWLPRISTGLTRQHLESLGVFAASCVVAVALVLRRHSSGSRRRPRWGISHGFGPEPPPPLIDNGVVVLAPTAAPLHNVKTHNVATPTESP